MSQPGFNEALRRKLAGGGGAATGPASTRPEGLAAALQRALGRAGAPYEGLALVASPAEPRWDMSLAEVIAALPEGGLLSMLEAGGDRRALCVLDHGLIDALIEVQTTGRVDRGAGLKRRPTRVDAALTRDFISLFLGALEGELTGRAGIDWPLGLTYGTHLAEARQLELLLPDRPHHLFAVTLDLGEAAKTGQILLAVPVTGTVAEAGPSPDAPANDPGWRARWQALVRAAPVALEGVLLRRTLPLARVEALNVGDVLSFDRAELATVDVADSAGQRRFTARLGQSAGRRALMLSDGMGLGPAPKADPPASEPPPAAPPPEPPPAVAPGAPPPA